MYSAAHSCFRFNLDCWDSLIKTDPDLEGFTVKGQADTEDAARFHFFFWDPNWFQIEELGAGDMAPIFQNAHLDYDISVHHLPQEVFGF